MLAVVYNNYLETAGGGERSTLEYALALDRLGYDIVLASAKPTGAALAELKARFGIPMRRSWKLIEFDGEAALERFISENGADVFVNHTFCSYMPNTAKFGIYVVMFPNEVLPGTIGHLQSYDQVVCISDFAEQYVRRRWSAELHTHVIAPPITCGHLEQVPVTFSEKERLVLNIGRFNIWGHNKCQLEAVQMFKRLVEQGVLDESWKLIVIGRVNAGEENEEYVASCRKEAQGWNIEILTDLALAELRYLYRRACCLWQCTGIHLPAGVSPHHCEHLGLVAMDCFNYGTIPIVYQRSGISTFIEYGHTGFMFADEEELKTIMQSVSSGFGSPRHRRMFEQILDGCAELSPDNFCSHVGRLLQQPRRDARCGA